MYCAWQLLDEQAYGFLIIISGQSGWPVRFMRIAGAAALFFICRRWTMIALIGIHLVGIFALTEGAAALIRRTAKITEHKNGMSWLLKYTEAALFRWR